MLIYETLFVEDLERYPANAEVITWIYSLLTWKIEIVWICIFVFKIVVAEWNFNSHNEKKFYTVILGENMSYVIFCRPKQNLCATHFTFSVELSYVEVNTEPFYVWKSFSYFFN